MKENFNSIHKAAKLAGFLFLWLIITGLTDIIITSFIEGSGTFLEKAKRIADAEHLYRFGLCIGLIETMSATLLGFTLYTALKSFNKPLAKLAMYWRFGESFIGGVSMVFAFAKLNTYLAAASAPQNEINNLESIVSFSRGAGFAFYNISATFFGIGSILFFYIFFTSRSIPRILSVIGLIASLIVPVMCIGSLLYPEYKSTLIYGWLPMAVAEVGTGIWLLLYGHRIALKVRETSGVMV